MSPNAPKLLNPNKPRERAFPVIKFHEFEYDGYIASVHVTVQLLHPYL
jgi:hypothetical protein